MYKRYPGNLNRVFLTSGFISTVFVCFVERVISCWSGHRLEVLSISKMSDRNNYLNLTYGTNDFLELMILKC